MKILVLLALFCCSCSSVHNWRHDMGDIYRMRLGPDSCTERADLFVKFNPKAIIIIVRLTRNGQLHAINYLGGYLIDCSFNKSERCLKGNIKEVLARHWGKLFKIIEKEKYET